MKGQFDLDDFGQGGLSRQELLKRAAAVGVSASALGALLRDAGVARAATSATVKIGFAYVGPITDGGWTLTHDLARRAVEKVYPNVETSYVENIPFSQEASTTFERLVAEGNKLIIVNSEYADFLSTVAAKHPDVMFLECNGHNYAPNLGPFYINQQDALYVVGIAAGLLTKTNKLGYIGSFPVAAVRNTASALLLGARSVNPKATVQVVSINSWFDPLKARQAANALIDSGADFTIGIMDEPAYLQASEKRGVWTAGWNVNMQKFAPTKYVSGEVQNWNAYYVKVVGQFLKSQLKAPNPVTLLPLANGVDRSAWGPNVPMAVRKRADLARTAILRKGFNPFTGPLRDNTGKLRVKKGQKLSRLEQYDLDWVVSGVKGLK